MNRDWRAGDVLIKSDYDADEALRVTEVTLMFEGETFTFQVRNSNKLFTLMLSRHVMRTDKPNEMVVCKHSGADNMHFEPCTAESSDIKEAAIKSIKEHRAKFHFLKAMK